MKNKILIAVALCLLGAGMSRCRCQTYMPLGVSYETRVINNTNISLVVETYFPTPQHINDKSGIIKANEDVVVFGFSVGASGEDGQVRYKFLSETDQAVIADTVMTIKPMPYEGVNYQTNITVNADKTLTIQSVPIVAPGSN